jgi:nitroimidazol reductase NimA-like FMN-containing flavoprotein (pyridoxamine 5'-phosphate oxidase superfamily)
VVTSTEDDRETDMDAFEDLQQATLVELDRAECLELLKLGRTGRIVYADADGPIAVPVNYRIDGVDVLFRVSPASKLGPAMDNATVAFEVDRLDDFHQTGWSVLVRGTSSYVEPDDVPAHLSERPVPWARGFRPIYVRVRPSRITGRRLVDD